MLPRLAAARPMAEAVNNSPALIVQAARRQPTAVMIARGVLAVEIGYGRLAEMQEDILWLCEAASIAVICATQIALTLL
jgi:pyruvate kinase